MTLRSVRGLRGKHSHKAGERAVGRLLLIAALASLPGACVERIGRKAAEGAMVSIRDQAGNRTGPPPAQVVAERAVQGAMNALDDPEQQARIQRMVAAAVAQVTRTMVDEASAELVAQLGPNGSGPLGASLSQAGQRVSTSVADGVVGGVVGSLGSELASLVPECAGPNRAACLQQRLQETTRTTAASFSKGLRDSIGWQFVLLAFALGAAGGALGSWLWSLRVARRSFRTA
jgi:hypothetical protein